jgi:hypothetical protein
LDQSRKQEAVRHELTVKDLWNAAVLGFEKTGKPANRKAICLLIAWILGESAGKPWCWNLTNIKANETWIGKWCEFGCGEEIRKADLANLCSLRPGCVTVRSEYMRAGEPWVSVHVDPPHPWARFRAYDSLSDGLEAKWKYLTTNRYALQADVLGALLTGDIDELNSALFNAHFYTAGKKAYRQMLASRLVQVTNETRDYDWTDVEKFE